LISGADIPTAELGVDGGAVDTELEAEAIALGEKIRTARGNSGVAMSTLAERAGVSKSLISQIEKGRVQPSITTLRRIARALDMPVANFFLGPEVHVSNDTDRFGQQLVVRKAERKHLGIPSSDIHYGLLVPDLNRRLEVLWGEVPPGADSPAEEPSTHFGEECIICIDGSFIMEIDGERFILEAGDSISFDPMRLHRIINPSTTPASIVVCITPPSY